MTTGTLPLDEILRQYTDMGEEEVGLEVARSNSRRNSTASASSARSPQPAETVGPVKTPESTADCQPASSVKDSGKSSRSSASSKSTGSKRRRSEGEREREGYSSILADSTEHSFDMSGDVSVSASRSRLLPLKGNRARASLSTSVVLTSKGQLDRQRGTQRRASVGPISSTMAASPVAKTKTKTAKAASPVVAPVVSAPVPRPPAVSTSFSVPTTVTGSILKSCLSSRKKQRPDGLSSLRFDLDTSLTASALKKSVVFGSPQALSLIHI